MTLPPLYIVGTGGFAKEVAQLATMLNKARPRWSSIEYIAQAGQALVTLPYGRIAGTDQILDDLAHDAEVAIGVGESAIRDKISKRLASNPLLSFPNLAHPQVEIDETTVRMGRGNFFARGCVLTCDIAIGDHNLFNYNTTIGHDCQIGSCNVINPGANVAGHVVLGSSCLVGTGAQILAHLNVADKAIVGAGAVLTRSITEPGIYTGVPARKK